MEPYEVLSTDVHSIKTSNDTADVLIYSEKECHDPLQGTDCGFESKFYRVNSIVFAEPLEIISVGNSHLENEVVKAGAKQNDVIVIDSVTVQQRTGKKYKKYYINIKDPSNLQCPQSNCNRLFSKIQLLKAHIRKVHCADKNRYICDVCGATFSDQYLLTRHSAVHSGKTVQCTVCDVMLRERTSLSAHLRTHSGIKPHACTACGKSFTRKSTLDNHIKFVHRDGQLQCPKCQDKFETRSQWNQHMSTHRTMKQNGAPN